MQQISYLSRNKLLGDYITAKIIEGKRLAEDIKLSLKKQIEYMKKKPGLAIIIVGTDFASKIYVNKKSELCKELGVYFEKYELPKTIKEKELMDLIEKMNKKKSINGILVQLPLPEHIDTKKIIESIDPLKDVDGFHPLNFGRLIAGEASIAPCTPRGIMKLLDIYGIEVKGKKVVVIGRSNIVGKPLALMLLKKDATVTICHSKTKNIEEITKQADILFSATGKESMVKGSMVKKGAVVVDVGITRSKNGKILGDIDFNSVKDVASYITPVPGGVGPMTPVMLIENLLICHKLQTNM